MLNLLPPPQASADVGAVSSLPALATASDVREAVMFLKRRPEGMTIVKAMSFEQRRLFDARKIEAYEYWGFILRTGERIRLSPRGQQLARRIEAEAVAYGRVLQDIAPYRAGMGAAATARRGDARGRSRLLEQAPSGGGR